MTTTQEPRHGTPIGRTADTVSATPGRPRNATKALQTSADVHSLLTEKDWQEVVCAYARLKGWAVYHTHDARRSAPGFPDLVLVRGERLVFAELKRETGRLRPEQAKWIAALSAVPGVDVRIWRPSAWVDVRDALC